MKLTIYKFLSVFLFTIVLATAGYGYSHHNNWSRNNNWDSGVFFGLATGIILGSMYQPSYYDNYYPPYYYNNYNYPNNYYSYYGPRYKVCRWVGGYYNEYGFWVPRQKACWWQ